jgi:hypothetical protein
MPANLGEELVLGAAYLCPRGACHMPSIVFFDVRLYQGRTVSIERKSQIPRARAAPMENLPEQIAEDRDEAWSCYYGGDLRAAVIMGRAAIQRTARVFNAKGKTLAAELDDLRERGVITLELRKWAEEVRIAGNDAAHPDELGKITPEEAEDSLDFMEEFLRHAVAMPARRRAREQARKSADEAA